ncbi:hypothetical protein C8R44DRAFT_9950 [Mycena epipterygia]|nr:hypothetical protein C8R44DRAFT_9950 [Mycena epipterygia]
MKSPQQFPTSAVKKQYLTCFARLLSAFPSLLAEIERLGGKSGCDTVTINPIITQRDFFFCCLALSPTTTTTFLEVPSECLRTCPSSRICRIRFSDSPPFISYIRSRLVTVFISTAAASPHHLTYPLFSCPTPLLSFILPPCCLKLILSLRQVVKTSLPRSPGRVGLGESIPYASPSFLSFSLLYHMYPYATIPNSFFFVQTCPTVEPGFLGVPYSSPLLLLVSTVPHVPLLESDNSLLLFSPAPSQEILLFSHSALYSQQTYSLVPLCEPK